MGFIGRSKTGELNIKPLKLSPAVFLPVTPPWMIILPGTYVTYTHIYSRVKNKGLTGNYAVL